MDSITLSKEGSICHKCHKPFKVGDVVKLVVSQVVNGSAQLIYLHDGCSSFIGRVIQRVV